MERNRQRDRNRLEKVQLSEILDSTSTMNKKVLQLKLGKLLHSLSPYSPLIETDSRSLTFEVTLSQTEILSSLKLLIQLTTFLDEEILKAHLPMLKLRKLPPSSGIEDRRSSFEQIK